MLNLLKRRNSVGLMDDSKRFSIVNYKAHILCMMVAYNFIGGNNNLLIIMCLPTQALLFQN